MPKWSDCPYPEVFIQKYTMPQLLNVTNSFELSSRRFFPINLCAFDRGFPFIHSVINFCAFGVLKQGPWVLLVRQDLRDWLDLSLVFLPSQKEGKEFNPPTAEKTMFLYQTGFTGFNGFLVSAFLLERQKTLSCSSCWSCLIEDSRSLEEGLMFLPFFRKGNKILIIV